MEHIPTSLELHDLPYVVTARENLATVVTKNSKQFILSTETTHKSSMIRATAFLFPTIFVRRRSFRVAYTSAPGIQES